MYTRVKVKCLQCGLHYVICTEMPERHTQGGYCPECGKRGSKIVCKEDAEGFIFQEVPGAADLGTIPG